MLYLNSYAVYGKTHKHFIALVKNGVPDKIVKLIAMKFENASAKVKMKAELISLMGR